MLESDGGARTRGVSTMQAQERAGRDLQVVGKNTLHSVTLLYLRGWDLQRKVRLLVTLGTPLAAASTV